jgi:hypothetical protein
MDKPAFSQEIPKNSWPLISNDYSQKKGPKIHLGDSIRESIKESENSSSDDFDEDVVNFDKILKTLQPD